MYRKAQFMPQAIHESTAFNSRNREVAIHCVFSVKDNTQILTTYSVLRATTGSFFAALDAGIRPEMEVSTTLKITRSTA